MRAIKFAIALIITSYLCGIPGFALETASKKTRKEKFFFREARLIDYVIGDFFAIWYSTPSESTRRITAKSLYSFTFQWWLVEGTEPGRRQAGMKITARQIMNLTREYIVLDDPLEIKECYNGDTLTGIRLRFQPLKDGEIMFKSKKRYERLVSEFLQWLNEKT